MTNALQASKHPTPSELVPGTILYETGGDVLVLTAWCLKGTGAPLALCQPLGREPQTQAYSLFEFHGVSEKQTPPRFETLAPARATPLQDAWRAHFKSDDLLNELLARYDESHRVAHARRSVLRMFETASALDLALGPNEVLALIAHKLVFFPGIDGPTQLEQSWLLARSQGHLLSGARPDWPEVRELMSKAGPVSDLLRSSLAAEPLEFRINEEMQWREYQHLYPEQSTKSEFETQRLKHLLELAGAGPMFSEKQPGMERKARLNIENLRVTWLKRHA